MFLKGFTCKKYGGGNGLCQLPVERLAESGEIITAKDLRSQIVDNLITKVITPSEIGPSLNLKAYFSNRMSNHYYGTHSFKQSLF